MECKVSSARIARFLSRASLNDYVQLMPAGSDSKAEISDPKDAAASPALQELKADADCVLAVRDASFSWGVVEPLADPMKVKKKKEGGRGCRGDSSKKQPSGSEKEGYEKAPTTESADKDGEEAGSAGGGKRRRRARGRPAWSSS